MRISYVSEGSMDTSEAVPASEFTRNFGRYRMRAQRTPVAVSSHGHITGYFIGADEYEEFRRFRESRRSFATAELSEEKVEAVRTSRMDPRHDPLDTLLDRD
jgi:PHD/YefM family antitoxin component YafN of YafNO toxin-antitoxin module